MFAGNFQIYLTIENIDKLKLNDSEEFSDKYLDCKFEITNNLASIEKEYQK